MQKLWSLLGFDKTAFEIGEYLSSSPEQQLAVITGSPGAGKSTLGKGIAASFVNNGWSAVVLEGDDLNEGREHFPFKRGLAAFESGWNSIAALIDVAPKFIDMFGGGAGAVTLAYESAKKLRAGVTSNRAAFFTADERAIISDLERRANRRPLLLIADNIHWWDLSSLQLLQQLISEEAKEAYPFLHSLKVVAIQAAPEEQPALHRDYLNKIISRFDPEKWRVERPSPELFEKVMLLLVGAGSEQKLPKPGSPKSVELANFVYLLSNGHLALARQAAAYLFELKEAVSFIGEIDVQEFAADLFERRLTNFGNVGEEALEILELASLIGLEFKHNELSCLSGQSEEQLFSTLVGVEKSAIVSVNEASATFSHDLFRRYFHRKIESSAAPYHAKLANCIRRFRPSDYLARSRTLNLAGQHNDATTMLFAQAAKNIRRALPWNNGMTVEERADFEHGDQGRCFRDWHTAWESLREYDFSTCFSSLNRLGGSTDKFIQGETDLLKTLGLLATRNETDRIEAYSILKGWDQYWTEEADLGVRLGRATIYAQSHLEDKLTARRTERKLVRFLSERINFDGDAEPLIHQMNRSSSALYTPEVALEKIRDATAFFAPKDGGTFCRDPIEYYRCLTNFGAGLISCAEYTEAVNVYHQLDKLVTISGQELFPRYEYPQNNKILALYRSEQISSFDARAMIQDLLSTVTTEIDPYYLLNSEAVYAMLAGDFANAEQIFSKLNSLLNMNEMNGFEPNMQYLIGSNYAGFLHLTGCSNKAQELWLDLYEVLCPLSEFLGLLA